ncbi:MAG: hypothetical protein J6386_24680 [Candidatus Synoicihabitans palmerolidicus]|nr:hypothetical protein [Candidatus Synoicihabitans palmerolidicus]
MNRTLERGVHWTGGGASPYLENGLLRFKAKWGPRLFERSAKGAEWQVVFDPDHAGCRRFIASSWSKGIGKWN